MVNRELKVLVIDDNQDNIIILQALIKEAFPYSQVITALSGENGLQLAAENDLDIILLDIVMPGMDGFEVCHRLKANQLLAEIPIIFITAIKGDKESRILALECGAEAFIAKPIDETELTAQIRAMKKIRDASRQKRDEKARLTKLVEEKTVELKIAHISTLNVLEELKRENEARKESEQRYRSIFDCAALGICNISLDGKYLHINKAFCSIVGYDEEELKSMSVFDITHPDDIAESEGLISKLINEACNNYTLDKRFIRKDGTFVSALVTVSVIKNSQDQPIYAVSTVQDISERIKAEKDLRYISYHDQLTGIYNRRFFEEELERLDTKRNLPISIVMGDVNGLKIINDSLGHTVGDELLRKVAETIKKECRADDIVARIGGDEFVMIFPQTTPGEANRIINRITEMATMEKVANIDLSISFGYDVKESEEKNISEVLAGAENEMYRHKLYERSSMKSKVVDIIMETLFEKSSRESLHSKRVSEISEAIAVGLSFNKDDINRVRVAGLVHDIGKIGVDEKILNKPYALEEDELQEIKKHPEMGWRILSSTNEFSEVAGYALNHHEKWDGTGYPKGISGVQIPIEARIIAVADAYDAMTSKRSYRAELPKEVAIKELIRFSGTQFDPEIVDIFVNKVLKSQV